MASILQLAAAPFRTRSPARDARTDHQRLDAIRSSITDAIESAKQEQQGLNQRLAMYQSRAAGLLDDTSAYGERSAAEERLLSEAERNVIAATERLKQLQAHIVQLVLMLEGTTDQEPVAALREA
jgi:hypothetical protein